MRTPCCAPSHLPVTGIPWKPIWQCSMSSVWSPDCTADSRKDRPKNDFSVFDSRTPREGGTTNVRSPAFWRCFPKLFFGRS